MHIKSRFLRSPRRCGASIVWRSCWRDDGRCPVGAGGILTFSLVESPVGCHAGEVLVDGNPGQQFGQRRCKHGSLLIWLDKEMIWLAPHDGSPGRPAMFLNAAIQVCLTIKDFFKLPLRQTAGMVASLLKLANLACAVPEYMILCRRQKTLAVQIPNRRADGPLNLLLDSTGIRFLGHRAWGMSAA